jgi:hypothetical protein
VSAPAADLVGIDELLELTEGAGGSGYREFRSILGPQQLALVDDKAPLVSAHPGRRAGKTTAFIGKALKTFDERRDAKVFYFAPTGEQGIDILWESIGRYNREFGLGLREHWSDGWWTRGERKLEVFSFHDRDDVERARGRYAHLVAVDEAQLAPDWFARKFEEAILPTTIDYLGQAWATGTPGPVSEGFFFEACHDTEKWSTGHHWTANDNPFFLRQGRDVLAEVRARFHFDEQNVTYRREWLGLWIVDPDALVYYIPDKAIVTAPADTQWFGNIIGLDFGWKDHDAIGIVGIEKLRQTSHLRHMETKGQQNNHELFRRIRVLAEKFPGPRGGKPTVVYDPAGHATRKTIETFRVDAPGIVWVQADKQRKVEFIDWLNNDLREGTTTVEADCSMVKEAMRLRWKRPGKVAEDADHSDQGDAWLYSWRHARDYLRKLPKKDKGEFDPFDEHFKNVAKPDGREGYFAERLRGIQ